LLETVEETDKIHQILLSQGVCSHGYLQQEEALVDNGAGQIHWKQINGTYIGRRSSQV